MLLQELLVVSEKLHRLEAEKTTIAEQLIRSEGHDVSSDIVSRMRRGADVLEFMEL
jgi:hypothetical protein